jgi:hypothetical protein
MKAPANISTHLFRIVRRLLIALAVVYLLLLIPDRESTVPVGANQQPFAWNRDAFWESLEKQFKEARAAGCSNLVPRIKASASAIQDSLRAMENSRLSPADPLWAQLETNLFQLAPLVAACPNELPNYLQLVTRLRIVVKRQSEQWNLNAPDTREKIYRLLYGSRAALEEVLLQTSSNPAPTLVAGTDEPSRTPSTSFAGVTVHSGDILVSRGGAPTSALISRGNDFPGNFSHVALLHVDEKTHAVSIIEAHIERGVVVSSSAAYLADKKLRVMVVRLRADLPQLVADPLLPHKAASTALNEVNSRHIPYDFAMNYKDHGKQFCSEVASAAYEPLGIKLWMGLSHLSSRGLLSWLSVFGVKHFETQEPSDLEYDPQLRVIAEWRDPETLFQDHADNAVIDVMLEGADAGERLGYDWYLLPIARILKTYSMALNLFGGAGPIPEGMSATAALRNQWFARKHQAIRDRALELAAGFQREHGYNAPYWELVELARNAKKEIVSR